MRPRKAANLHHLKESGIIFADSLIIKMLIYCRFVFCRSTNCCSSKLSHRSDCYHTVFWNHAWLILTVFVKQYLINLIYLTTRPKGHPVCFSFSQIFQIWGWISMCNYVFFHPDALLTRQHCLPCKSTPNRNLSTSLWNQLSGKFRGG